MVPHFPSGSPASCTGAAPSVGPVDGEQREDTTLSVVPGHTARQRSEALKERVYVTFTVLAVTITLERDAEHASVGELR